jgi:hypothetical protein
VETESAAGGTTTSQDSHATQSIGDRLRATAAAYREAGGVGKSRNIAVSALEIDGEVVDTKLAVSGESPRKGAVSPLNTLVLEPQVVGHPRLFDSEFKLMQDFADRYSTSTTGTLHVFTELPPCESCANVVRTQIPQIFPGIKVEFH